MGEARDPAIKLFGRTIALPEGQQQEEEACAAAVSKSAGDAEETRREVPNSNPNPDVSEEAEKCARGDSSSTNNAANREIQQASVQDCQPTTDRKPEQDQNETDISGQEKVLKKPDKILPCPRCSSMDTKFCYYNNYNVNQPRHFCKNCQRYWTAGGTMRNMPVGAGRRKNKHSSQYRQLMMSSDVTMTASKVEPQEAHHQPLPSGGPTPIRPLKVDGSVLKFGSEAPLCESMASALHLGEPKRNADLDTVVRGGNMEEHSCASSVTISNHVEKVPEKSTHLEKSDSHTYCNGVAPIRPLQCYPGPPCVYPWVSAIPASKCSFDLPQAPENHSPSPLPWGPTPMVATPGLCASAFPFPFMPASIWGGCMPSWSGGTWNVPWIGPNAGLSPSSSSSYSNCSGNGSPTLGKHSRESSSFGDEKVKRYLWAPKTLRIDDPDEAAKSSIWATLGIERSEGNIFKTFQTKAGSGTPISDASQVLQANPAALSRSQIFQEST